MASKGNANIGIPIVLYEQVTTLKKEFPELFHWRSANDFCSDAVRRFVESNRKEFIELMKRKDHEEASGLS